MRTHLAKLLDVVTIDNDGVEAKSFKPLTVDFHVMLQRRRFRLTQTVDVKNGAKVVQMIMTSKIQGLPNGTLSTLTITNQAVGPMMKEIIDFLSG